MLFLGIPLMFFGFGGLFTLMMYVTAKTNATGQAVGYASLMAVLMVFILIFRYKRVSTYWNDYQVEVKSHTISVRAAGRTLFESPVKELSFVERSKSTGLILLGHPRGGISVPLAIEGADDLLNTLARIRSGEWVEDHVPEPPLQDLLADRLNLVFSAPKYNPIASNVSFSRMHSLSPFPAAAGIAIAITALFNLLPWWRQGIGVEIPLTIAVLGAVVAFLGFRWRVHFSIHLSDGKLTRRTLLGSRTDQIQAFGVNPCNVLTLQFRSIGLWPRDYLFAFAGGRLVQLSRFQDFPEHVLDLARDLAARTRSELVQGPVSVGSFRDDDGEEGRHLVPSRKKFRMNWWVPAALLGGGAAGIMQLLVPDLLG